MLVLGVDDSLRGNASVADVIDYQFHGLAGDVFSFLANGKLAAIDSELFPATAITVLKAGILANTHDAAVTINLSLLKNGGTARRLIPTDLILEIGHALYFDGLRFTVVSPSGAEVTTESISDEAYDKTTWAGVKGISAGKGVLRDEFELKADLDSPALVTPALGTPASGNLKDCTEATKTTKGVVRGATNAEIAAFGNKTRYVSPEGLGYAMAGALAYGVDWDESDPSPILTRTGVLAGIAAASSPGNACLPVQAAMRRCILNDAGVVQYYLGATDSTKKEDMSTASNLDGTDGQVVVEIPLFWYWYFYFGTIHSWLISLNPFPGAVRHPAFFKDGAWVARRYIGAYEGVGWDDSVSDYIDHGNVAATGWSGSAIDLVNDKLSSVSGKNPITDETRAEFRAIALNRGVGWRQQDFYLVSAIQLLYLTEYASWNSQSMIGMGRTHLSAGAWVQGSYIKETGLSNGDGNATNSVDWEGDADHESAETVYMTYRGIENFYGHIWKWVDGFNILGGIPYVSNVETDFDDDTDTNYYRLLDTGGGGITLPQGVDDYPSTLKQIKDGFLPSALDGSSSTYITDYYYQNAGWRVAAQAAAAASGLHPGVACWHLGLISTDDNPPFGGRISF